MIYRARKQQMSYGRPLGIISLEEFIPCPPGTPGNPTTFSHPVMYEVVKDANIGSLIGLNNPDSRQAFLNAGRALVEKGVSAIAGNCGLMIVHQAALAKALPVPVLMSSLLQLPLIASLIGPDGVIGVMASSRNNLKPEHLLMATAGAEIPVAIATMDGKPHFRDGMAGGVLDSEKAEAEVVEVAQALITEKPDVRAILFECVDLPPYAHAVQEATGRPVFDITTLVGHALSGLIRRPFSGAY
ncbi:MAG: asp/Glu/Hydantoin racemase family protein [Rhodospirillales bacterium]|nr:asp/Glu/Hydantoin racemase family protein [Rhodospirillales bacterium]